MKIERSILSLRLVKETTRAAAVAVLAASTLAGAGLASADQGPEMRIRLISSTAGEMSWDTHGRTECTLTADGFVMKTDLPTTGGTGVFEVTKQSGVVGYQILCPGPVRSNVAKLYMPRNALNDARTNFNIDTDGMFGS